MDSSRTNSQTQLIEGESNTEPRLSKTTNVIFALATLLSIGIGAALIVNKVQSAEVVDHGANLVHGNVRAIVNSGPTATASATGLDQVTLDWEAISHDKFDHYKVEYRQAVSGVLGAWNSVLTANVTSFNVTGLGVATEYQFRVRWCSETNVCSSAGSVVSATTDTPTVSITDPVQLMFQALDTDGSGNLTSTEVQVQLDGQGLLNVTVEEVMALADVDNDQVVIWDNSPEFYRLANAILAQFDLNRDGIVTGHEVSLYMGLQGLLYTATAAEDLMTRERKLSVFTDGVAAALFLRDLKKDISKRSNSTLHYICGIDDDNKNGHIDPIEFRQWMFRQSRGAYDHYVLQQAYYILEGGDTSGNEFLEADECDTAARSFLSGVGLDASAMIAPNQTDTWTCFQSIDDEGDWCVDPDKVTALAGDGDKEAVSKWVGENDFDSSGCLSYSEFILVLEASRRPLCSDFVKPDLTQL